MSRGRAMFICLDCGQDTGKMNEYYFVHTPVWLSVVGSKNGMLCIGCLEARLGRELNSGDFTDCWLNNLKSEFRKSDRLVRRLTKEAT